LTKWPLSWTRIGKRKKIKNSAASRWHGLTLIIQYNHILPAAHRPEDAVTDV
jgi:hypothetical protein